MCTTTQFFFVCGHAATDQFRDGVCARPDVPNCYRDHPRAITLPKLCVACQQKYNELSSTQKRDVMHGEIGRRHEWATANEQPMNQIWQIPSRCFIDPGFQRIDPFAADGIKQEIEAFENGRYPPNWVIPPLNFRKRLNVPKPTTVYKRPPQVMYRMPPAPCCQSTMIRCWQGLKKVATGRHIDNRCRSGF